VKRLLLDVNVVLDLVGSSYLEANLEALGLHGRLLLVGPGGGASAPLNWPSAAGVRKVGGPAAWPGP